MHADLFPDEGGFTPRPAWQVIEAARRQHLTAELSLPTTPPTNVYLRDGQVYFAERTTDGGLGVRLLVEGVITRQQMGKGAVLVGGVEHLGRMFDRDPSIDRDSVELCVELMTDDVLGAVADELVSSYRLHLYRRHTNGIDRWLRNRVEVITHIVEGAHLAEPDATVAPGTGPRVRPVNGVRPVNAVAATTADAPSHLPASVPADVPASFEPAPPAQAPITGQTPVVAAEPVATEPVATEAVAAEAVAAEPVAAQPAAPPEARTTAEPAPPLAAPNALDAVDAGLAQLLGPPPAAAQPSLGGRPTASPDPVMAARPESPAVGTPAFDLSQHTSLLEASAPLTPEAFLTGATEQANPEISLAQSAVDAIMSTAIADEVAEAVRRALAAIDAAAQPTMSLSPSDFDPATNPTLERDAAATSNA
ncbi:MAG: hypothetical protein Q7V88_15085 [Actinomycetota bacterium]|nr:hypothetical protein [Actinomycetota bacterium]